MGSHGPLEMEVRPRAGGGGLLAGLAMLKKVRHFPFFNSYGLGLIGILGLVELASP